MPSPLLHVRLDLDHPNFSKSLAVYYGKGGNCLKSGLYMFSGQNIDFAYVSDSLQQFKKFDLFDLSDLYLTFNHTRVQCQIILHDQTVILDHQKNDHPNRITYMP